MIAQEDNYPEVLAAVIAQLAAGDREAAQRQMAEISYTPREIPKRPSIPRAAMDRVFRRDRWTCRYCGGAAIFTPVMALLGKLFPDEFPYHSNWKVGLTHPAVITRSAIVDHVVPGGIHGDWLDESNLVTACWPCNARKADFTPKQLAWDLRPIPQSSWDGLTTHYPKLWVLAGRPRNEGHPAWLRVLGDGGA